MCRTKSSVPLDESHNPSGTVPAYLSIYLRTDVRWLHLGLVSVKHWVPEGVAFPILRWHHSDAGPSRQLDGKRPSLPSGCSVLATAPPGGGQGPAYEGGARN